jgi:hypothetical protein
VETAEAECLGMGVLISENAGVRNRDAARRIIGHSDASSRCGMGNAQGRGRVRVILKKGGYTRIEGVV